MRVIAAIIAVFVLLGILTNGCSTESDCKKQAQEEQRDMEWTGYLGIIGSCSPP